MRNLRKAIAAFSEPENWFDAGSIQCTIVIGFQQWLGGTVILEGEDRLAAIMNDNNEATQDKVQQTRTWMKSWAPKQGRTGVSHVISEDSELPRDVQESVGNLIEYQEPKFNAPHAEVAARRVILEHVQRYDGNTNWIVSRKDFGTIVESKKDGGTGPDGILYSAYAQGGATTVDAFYDCYYALLDGAS